MSAGYLPHERQIIVGEDVGAKYHACQADWHSSTPGLRSCSVWPLGPAAQSSNPGDECRGMPRIGPACRFAGRSAWASITAAFLTTWIANLSLQDPRSSFVRTKPVTQEQMFDRGRGMSSMTPKFCGIGPAPRP